MDIAWSLYHQGIGNALGYTTMEARMLEALEANDVHINRASPVVVHFMPFYQFCMWRFRRNILYTMWEFDRVPCQWHAGLERAELIIVPCRQNKEVMTRATSKPIEICPAGVDSGTYGYKVRTKSEPFMFLYVGAKTPRKGTHHISKAWALWNEKYPEFADKSILVMKETEIGMKQELIQVTKNAYVDSRVLPLTDDGSDLPSLVSLYHAAHCFLFPSMGEGFGLTLAEAMSTGLPCIYTPWGGPEDFADEQVAYPIKYGARKIDLLDKQTVEIEEVYGADPDIESIVEQMRRVYCNYDEALERGRIAAIKMRECLTWDMAAQRFKEILQDYFPGGEE